MKHRLTSAILLISLVMLVALMLASNVMAQSPTPKPEGAEAGFDLLLSQWAGLAGFGALISLLINIGKTVGFIKDGQAKNWSAGLNLAGLIFLLSIGIVKPEINIVGLDQNVSEFASVASVIAGYIIQLAASRLTHGEVKGLPLIGKTFTPLG